MKLTKISAEKSLRRNTGSLEIDHFQGRISQVKSAEMDGKQSLVHDGKNVFENIITTMKESLQGTSELTTF